MDLKPEQKLVVEEAVQIIDKWGMCYLACRPRYGKSLIAMRLAELYGGRILFATPKSAIPGLKKVQNAMGINQDITVSTYGSLHKIKQEHYDMIFLDEAHSNISSYPKMSKSREKLEPLVGPKTIVIWMSGSPAIESSSKLFHQLSLSPRHSFRKFGSFHEWFNPKGHYADPHKGGGYGIYGETKYTGSSRPAINYDNTYDFSDKFNPIMIRRSEEEQLVDVIVRYYPPTNLVHAGMHEIKTKNIFEAADTVFISDGGASKLSKQHQLSGGTCIDVKGDGILLDYGKAQELARNHKDKNCCIFYKYVAEKELLSLYFDTKDLFQIDSNCTGIDLSHYDEMAIYSLTWSGSTYTQVLSRLVNTERDTIPNIYIYLTIGGPDEKIYAAVSNKKDMNEKFLRK